MNGGNNGQQTPERRLSSKSKPKQPKKRHRLAHGEGSFYYRTRDHRWVGSIDGGITANGTRRRIVVTDQNEDVAWDKLQAKRKALALGQLAATGSDSLTVSQWAKTWLAERKKRVRPKTYSTDAGAINNWVIPTIGRTRLRDLGAEHVRAVGKAALDAGRSSTTARYAQGRLKQTCKAARAEGHQVGDPVLLATTETLALSDRDAIPLDEALKILRAALDRPDASTWIVAFIQGVRQGERLGLTWECIDFEHDLIDISWQLQSLPYLDRDNETFDVPANYERRHLWRSYHLVRPKSKAGHRVVPMVPGVRDALIEWRKVAPHSPHGLVWCRPGGEPINPKHDANAFKDLQDAAGVTKGRKPDGKPYYYVLHEIRHTTVTLLLELGIDPGVITTIVGHSNIMTTRGYQHVSTELSRRALTQVAEQLQIGR
ncbi:MAG: site-specific integrase [Bowdeniella nasicola]|nr:site-specific integrase [Bowdeniella nasicola]